MLNILYFNYYHDSKILGFIYFVGLKCTRSHWPMWPNVEFQIKLSKTNPDLAKSHLQRKTHGYAPKTAPDKRYPSNVKFKLTRIDQFNK